MSFSYTIPPSCAINHSNIYTLNSRNTWQLAIPWMKHVWPHLQDFLVQFPYSQILFLPAPESAKILTNLQSPIRCHFHEVFPNSLDEITILRTCSPSGFGKHGTPHSILSIMTFQDLYLGHCRWLLFHPHFSSFFSNFSQRARISFIVMWKYLTTTRFCTEEWLRKGFTAPGR